MVSSLSCLYFFQAVLMLPTPLFECNMSGLDLKSAHETLLMTSHDIVTHVKPLTQEQYVEFITWRHSRNIAQENAQPYDASSKSAVAFDTALEAAKVRLQVTFSEQLQIQVKGQVLGSNATLAASSREARTASDDDPAPGTVSPAGEDTTSTPVTSKSLAAPTTTSVPLVLFAQY